MSWWHLLSAAAFGREPVDKFMTLLSRPGLRGRALTRTFDRRYRPLSPRV
jgi:hypothetical protein